MSSSRRAIYKMCTTFFLLSIIETAAGDEAKTCILRCTLAEVDGSMCVVPHLDARPRTFRGRYGPPREPDISRATKLEVYGQYLPRKAIECFSQASELRDLAVCDVALEENALAPLSSCGNIKRLYMGGPNFEAKDLLPLYQFQCELKEIVFSDTDESYQLFSHFLADSDAQFHVPDCMKTLEEFVFVGGCDWFNEDYLAMFGRMPDLKRLRLDDTGIKPGHMHRLPVMGNLERLSLTGNAIVDKDLEAISRLRRLRILGLSRTAISSEGLKQLAKLKELETLVLSENFNIRSQGVAYLARLPHLKCLYLGSTGIDDRAMKHVAKMSKLETLEIVDTHVTDKGLFELASLQKLQEVCVKKMYPVCLYHLSETYEDGDYWSSFVTKEGFEQFEEMVGHKIRDGGRY